MFQISGDKESKSKKKGDLIKFHGNILKTFPQTLKLLFTLHITFVLMQMFFFSTCLSAAAKSDSDDSEEETKSAKSKKKSTAGSASMFQTSGDKDKDKEKKKKKGRFTSNSGLLMS